MTDKNTAATNTTTKAAATGTKPVATPKKEEPKTLDVYGKEMVEELDKRTKAIKSSIGKIDKSFENIAFNLYWIHSKEAFKAKGADSIVKYAADAFGYEKTTCYSLIAIVERFAKRDEKGNFLEEFDPKYKGYSSSKLSLMVGLTDEQISGLKPEMSVRDIKKYVASLKEKPLSALPDGTGEEETENVTVLEPLDISEVPDKFDDSALFNTYTRDLFTVNGFDDYNKQLDKIDETIHKLYKDMPDVTIRIVIDRAKPFEGKWVK